MQRLNEFFDDEAGLMRALTDYVDPSSVAVAIAAARRIGKALQRDPLDQRRDLLRQITNRITVEPGLLTISVDRVALASLLIGTGIEPDEATEQHLSLTCPISLRRRGVENRIVIPGSNKNRDADPALIALLSRAHCYLHQLTVGSAMSLSEVAALNQVDLGDVSRTLPLAFLSPRITDAIISETQPAELTAQTLSRLANPPISWSEQADRLGF
ncbi:MAG: hypothetical protein JNL61_11835 [Rhizobiaceae bacterium]|nr:hypothetical protein [Rhizobiaceae bacterium]